MKYKKISVKDYDFKWYNEKTLKTKSGKLNKKLQQHIASDIYKQAKKFVGEKEAIKIKKILTDKRITSAKTFHQKLQSLTIYNKFVKKNYYNDKVGVYGKLAPRIIVENEYLKSTAKLEVQRLTAAVEMDEKTYIESIIHNNLDYFINRADAYNINSFNYDSDRSRIARFRREIERTHFHIASLDDNDLLALLLEFNVI